MDAEIRRRWGAGAIAAAILFAVALPASASAYVYWVNEETDSIGRAGLDGSAPNPDYVAGLGSPTGVAVDPSHIYWSDAETDSIGRADLDGSDRIPSFISGANNPSAIAIHGGRIYWVNQAVGKIGRANVNGTEVTQSLVEGLSNVESVTADDAHVYWATYTAGSAIGRANLNGGEVNGSFITGTSFPHGLAADAGHIYWANYVGDTIGRANLNGSSPNQSFITGASFAFGVAVDAGHVYWAGLTPGTIGRSNLDGSGVNAEFITGLGKPAAVAVDQLPVPTSTTLSCAPASLFEGKSATCTATVTDTGAAAGSPAGTVAFSGGAFTPATSCQLIAANAAQASCPVTFVGSSSGTRTLTASYGGELTHAASSGTALVEVTAPEEPSNDFRLGRPKLDAKRGTASLTATVPGPGRLDLSGTGVKNASRRAQAAGRVKLAIKPAKRAAAKLRETGTARVTARVTFTPSGGEPRSRTVHLKLRLE